MPTVTSSAGLRFSDLVFSDLQRFRPTRRPSWPAVLSHCLANPGMQASVVVRAQQCAHRAGRVRLALLLRTVGMWMFGADFVPGMDIGPGLMLAHPNGIVMGNEMRIGANVSFGGGVTAGVKQPDAPAGHGEFPTIADGAIVLANAVLVGGVTVGNHAQVGANSVVLSDVADNAVVFGVPARKVGEREPIVPGSSELVGGV